MAASMLLRVFRCTRSLCCVGPCLVMLLLTYVPHAATACRMVSVDIAAEFQVVTLQGCDQEPRMLGYLLGNHTADMIQGRLAESAAAQRCRVSTSLVFAPDQHHSRSVNAARAAPCTGFHRHPPRSSPVPEDEAAACSSLPGCLEGAARHSRGGEGGAG